VFRWKGTTWAEEQKLLAGDGAREDWFGSSVSVSGDVAVVGAYKDDDNGADSGSAYAFSLVPPDCNGNGILDSCDIADGVSQDANRNGIPDECVLCVRPCGDFDFDGDVDLDDFAAFQQCVTGQGGAAPPSCATFDFDHDFDIDLRDFGFLQALFTG
jgi:hypothetical protein